MRKRLIAIAICAAVIAPLTAQAAVGNYFEAPTHQVSVAKETTSKSIASVSAAKVTNNTVALFDRPYTSTGEPATVIAASGNCTSCHSVKGDVPGGVSGGDSIGISKTS